MRSKSSHKNIGLKRNSQKAGSGHGSVFQTSSLKKPAFKISDEPYFTKKFSEKKYHRPDLSSENKGSFKEVDYVESINESIMKSKKSRDPSPV